MGQKFGRATLHPVVDPFANLPRKTIANIWQVYNDLAEGHGINLHEMIGICADLKDDANVSRDAMTEKSEMLFQVLDTDKNGLIDALEMMSTIAAVSGMRIEEIMEFILTSYDFDSVSTLSLDEVTLALKSTAVGLSKISNLDIPTEETIGDLVTGIYREFASDKNIETMRLRIRLLTNELCSHPDVKTWYAYYATPKQAREESTTAVNDNGSRGSNIVGANEFKFEHLRTQRSSLECRGMAWDVRTEVEESRGVSLVRESLPWTKSVEQLVPSSFANAVIPEDCPDESIEIDWIYGYQSERSRNNVRYNHQGNLVYPVGRYVIVYSFSAHAQKIFSTHTEEVTSLAMHPEGVLVATGEAGRTSRLMVWHSESMAIHFSDMTMHKDGILHITFSPDGKRLISVGNDPFHTMCVFYWEENRVLYTSQVHGNDCLGLAVLADNTLVAVGDSYIFFWTKSVEGYSKRKGIFTRTASIQPLTCVAQVGNVDTVVTGSQSGQLFIWIDCNCVRTIRGHEGAVTCVYSSSYGILSGGVDNRIRLWTHRFEPGASFDCSNLGPIPSIRSLCMSSDGTTILVGTRGACIFELSSVDGSDLRGGAIASGHFEGQVTGVSTHPNKLEFVTTGEDKQVRVIDLVTHTTLKLASFDTSVRAVAYAPAGDSIAVGLGGDSDKSKLGTYVILNERDMSIVHETRDSTSMVTRLVYSADGETLAVAFAEGTICLYGVHEDYDIVARYKSPSKRPITNIDFSVDGEVIRFNDIDNELTFFSIEKATVLTNYESLRDVQWSTCSSSQHWHTQSMHFVGFPGERVVCSQMANRDSLAVTCGTSLGYLRIHPFPITSHTAEYKRIAAHVGSVAEISYSNERTYLFSAGASDRCIVQWRRSNYMPGLGLAGAKFPDLQEAEDILLETRSGIEVFKDSMSYESAAPEGLLNADEYNGVPITLVNRNEPEINIWLQSVVTPANPAEQKLDIPPVSLKLEYVHGYRCVEMRNNLAYVSPSEIAFCAASVGVVMDRQSKSQKFYEVHTDMISAFAVSTDGKYCATGQSGATPKVTVWSTASCTLLVLVPDLQLHSVCSLAFSDNGEYLAVVSADENHTISIYNWRRQTVLSKFYMGVAHVFDICFTENDQSLFVCSTKDLMLWENVTSKVPISRRPMLAETGMWQPFLCCRPFNDSVLVGTADGSMYMFHDAILSMAVPAHRAALTAMDVNKHRMQVITGSKDGYVRVWNHLLECVHELKISRAIVSQNPCVTCVAFSMDGLHAVVGTQGAELFEMNTSIETPHTARPLLYGHGCRELWGLASHPTREEFATTGDDAKLRIWEAKKCTLLRTVVLECASQAVAYSPDGRFIAIGLGNSNHEKEKTRSTAKTGAGGFIILCTKKYAIVHQARDSKEAIRTMKFSPDSKFLAMGSFDAQIYTYSVEDNFVKKVFISGVHMAPVVNLDYSVTGEYILSVDSTRRMVFTEASTGAHIASAAVLRDEKWSTWSSPVGWSIQGLWLSQPKGCDPCSAQRSFNGQLLATGNTGGKIYLSNYPCQSQAGFASSGGHAGPVSRICWLPGDSSLISIGQKDYSIFQWKVQYADTRESGDEGGLSVNECSAAENEIGFECQNTNEEQFESMELTSKYSVICPPSNPKVADDSPPNLDTRLEYVHGVRISDCRQNIRYNNDGNLVFISVTVGIVFSRAEQSQLVYTGHNKALISFDVDGSGSLAASGEQGSSPEVHIWDARTASEIAQFKNLHKRGVGSIAFAPSGEYLVTMGMDMMHSIVVLRSPSKRWTDGHIQCSASVSRRRMLWCAYLENNEYPIAVGGSHAMCFFKFRGRSVERQKGMFGRRKKIQPLLCATVTQYEVDGKLCDSVITGTVSGHIYAWYDRRIAKSVSGHDNAITSIAGISKGDFATGCRDGHIKIWNSYLEPQRSLQVSLFSPQPESFACHALRVNGIGSRLTIGMKSGELYEISLATKTYSQLADGHSHMKLRGLAVNPLNTDIYATCGDDGAVRIWSSSSRKCLQTASFDSACSCLAYSSDSSRLLIGTGGNDTQPAKDGVVIILDSESLESLSKERIAKHGIESIRFSPTGEIFAMASRDGIGYIYDFDTLSLKQTLSTKRANHKCIFGFIDFSEDGSVIRFAPNYVELFYFDVESGEAITETSMTKDLFWDTYTCPNTWMTQGIARPASEEAPIIAVTLNQKRTLVAVSYADGAVRIYRYPCLTQTSGYVHVPGLATYSSQLGFSAEDKNLIVLDTLTRSVMQYIITYK